MMQSCSLLGWVLFPVESIRIWWGSPNTSPDFCVKWLCGKCFCFPFYCAIFGRAVNWKPSNQCLFNQSVSSWDYIPLYHRSHGGIRKLTLNWTPNDMPNISSHSPGLLARFLWSLHLPSTLPVECNYIHLEPRFIYLVPEVSPLFVSTALVAHRHNLSASGKFIRLRPI